MADIKELLRMIPTGEWYKTETGLIDPDNNKLELKPGSLSSIQYKIYIELLYQLLNKIPLLLDELQARNDRIEGLRLQINRIQRKNNKAFIKGIESSADIVSETEVTTLSARDSVNSIIDRLRILRDNSIIKD